MQAHTILYTASDRAVLAAAVQARAQELIPSGYQLDLMRLAPERDEETGKVRDISIESAHQLKSWAMLRPIGAHKVAIIEDADRLGGEAANALLKILEEPPAYAHFFLTTTQPGQLLPTIRSRCERIEVTAPPRMPSTAAVAACAVLEKTLAAGISVRLAYAKTLADNPDAPELVRQMIDVLHQRLAKEPGLAPVIHGLLELGNIIGESQFNRRLAIERFLLADSVQK